MKNTSNKHLEFASFEKLGHDEKAIFKNAYDYWLKKYPDDKDGAHLCPRGAVIVYGSLVNSMDSDDETEEEQTEQEYVSSCLDVTAGEGTKYVAYFRGSRRDHSEQYAVIYAGSMLFTDNSDIADECARFAENGASEHNINDSRVAWMLSKSPEDILENCLLAGEGELEPEDFSPSVCEGCDRNDCDWHPDTLADEESFEAEEDDDYDPEA